MLGFCASNLGINCFTNSPSEPNPQKLITISLLDSLHDKLRTSIRLKSIPGDFIFLLDTILSIIFEESFYCSKLFLQILSYKYKLHLEAKGRHRFFHPTQY